MYITLTLTTNINKIKVLTSHQRRKKTKPNGFDSICPLCLGIESSGVPFPNVLTKAGKNVSMALLKESSFLTLATGVL